jgi:hypothetical protein
MGLATMLRSIGLDCEGVTGCREGEKREYCKLETEARCISRRYGGAVLLNRECLPGAESRGGRVYSSA